MRSWYTEAIEAAWTTPEQAKAQFPKASIIANNRVVFDIAGNAYRLIVSMNYKFQSAYIKFSVYMQRTTVLTQPALITQA